MHELVEQRDYAADPFIETQLIEPPVTDEPRIPSDQWALQLEVQVVDFLSGYSISGVLESFTPGEVTVMLNEPLSEQRTVSVRLNSFVFEGETLYCGPRSGGYEAHISISDAGQNGMRRSPRFPVNFPGQLFSAQASAVSITIVDISRDGLGVDVPVALDPGQPIAVSTGSVFVFAIVRHCRPVPHGLYRAGVEMHHLFETSTQAPAEPPGAGILRKVWGKHFSQRTH
jgi:hypothetical protein